jgi:2-oxoglutarate ferredoxin oxidoreductase subunit beta
MKPKKDLSSHYTQSTPNWCPGCGNYGIWVALKNALQELKLPAHKVVLVGDIGCSGKLAYWTDYNGFGSLHGRSIPIAEGVKMANSDLTVIVVGGDGGLLGEGLQHFLHACRRNVNIAVILHNNQVYGLTTGQTSPTSDPGYKSSTTPEGSYETPLNPSLLALTAQATFVSAGFAGNTPHLAQVIKSAILHSGFALVDIYQPCVTYNYINTYEYYSKRVYDITTTPYKPNDRFRAMKKSMEIEGGKKFPIGIIFQDENRPSLQANIQNRVLPLVKQPIKNISVKSVFEKE